MDGDRRDDGRGRNVRGGLLAECGTAPVTGWFRDGCCRADPRDHGQHTVCGKVTAEFLAFSKASGNDLGTPRPEYEFPGLKPGDRWCLCAARWLEAYRAGKACPVILSATHERALDIIPLAALEAHAFDKP